MNQQANTRNREWLLLWSCLLLFLFFSPLAIYAQEDCEIGFARLQGNNFKKPLQRLLYNRRIAKIQFKNNGEKLRSYDENIFYPELKKILSRDGITTGPYTDSFYPHIEITSEGNHPFSKIVSALNGKGIKVKISTAIWDKALGAANYNSLFVDQESIISKSPSTTFLHELRHINGNLKTRQNSTFERLFSTRFYFKSESKGSVAGMVGNRYKDNLSMDEILAFRQHMELQFRKIEKDGLTKPQSKKLLQETLNDAKLFGDMMNAWIINYLLIRKQVASKVFDSQISGFKESPYMTKFELKFRDANLWDKVRGAKDPHEVIKEANLGFQYPYPFDARKPSKAEISQFALKQLDAANEVMTSIEDDLRAFVDIANNYSDKKFPELLAAFRKLNKKIAEQRAKVNAKP